MAKTVSRSFTKWVVVVLSLSLLFGIAGFIAPSAHAATNSVVATHAVHHAPIRHSKANCVPSRQTPNGCLLCYWSQLDSNSYGTAGNGYYKAVFIYAEYDDSSGDYCGYVAVQAKLDQPPHQAVSTLFAGLAVGGCGGWCISNTIQVTPNLNYKWWYTNWVSMYYNANNGCIYGVVAYLQLPATYTRCKVI